MKTILELELIGDDTRTMFKIYKDVLDMGVPGLFDFVVGKDPNKAWVAEITGFDAKYKYNRCFLQSKKDYSRANSKGSRGIYAEYVLETGRIYEVKCMATWSRFDRYFCMVTNAGDIVRIEQLEVDQWLKSRSE
jgi:hypothetical protein